MSDDGRELIARWESDGGKYWVELYRDRWGYGHDSKSGGGHFGHTITAEADAVAWIEERTRGGAGFFHSGKRDMRQVFPVQGQ